MAQTKADEMFISKLNEYVLRHLEMCIRDRGTPDVLSNCCLEIGDFLNMDNA